MRSGILEFLGGLGLFLFGLAYLEDAVSAFSRGGFKQMIKKFTANTPSSLLTGIVTTLIVQSSNLVSVLVLAFVGTGVLSLTGALAVILGANIGTTIPDAILGAIGMNYDIKVLTYPLFFLGAIGITFFSRKERILGVAKAFIGLALIFLSFAFMKSGLVFVTEMIDLTEYLSMNSRIFFLIGLVLTLLVQSGGATFIVALTSVSSGLITPEVAFPIILASFLGSTITIILGSLGNQPAIKKQVAAGHVGFNILVSFSGMLLLPWIIDFFSSTFFSRWGAITGLSIFYVGYRSLIALLVLPFLGAISRFLENKIVDNEQHFSLAVQKVPTSPVDHEMALLAIKQDILIFFKEVVGYNLNIWDFYLTDISKAKEKTEEILARDLNFGALYLKREYQEVKEIQEELLTFLFKVQQTEEQNPDISWQFSTLYQVIIDIGDSSKYLKDVRDRVEDWQWSTSKVLQKDYLTLRKMVLDFYTSLLQLLANLDNREFHEMLHDLLKRIEKNDKKYFKLFHNTSEKGDLELANLIQVNRYFSMSCLSLVKAMESIEFTPEESKYLKEYVEKLF